jgi:hypothetical protein
LYRQSETKGHRLILRIDRDSLVAIKNTGYRIFTGLSQGTVKVLKDPEAQREEVVLDTASSKSVSEDEGDDIPTSPDDRLGTVKSSSADQGTPLMETQSDEMERAKEERMETDILSKDKKELNTYYTEMHTNTAHLHNKIPSN